MKKIQTVLLWELWISVALSLVLVILFENSILYGGLLATEKSAEFITLSILEIVTISFIPLALRLFKIKIVHRQLVSEIKEHRLLQWGSLRLSMICIPMFINTLLYYLYMNVAFGYMAIIQLLCLFFVYPSMQRCLSETDRNNR